MKKEKGQMLLLTGITIIILFVASAFISTNLSNVNVQISLDEIHPLYQEYIMVKKEFTEALDGSTANFEFVNNTFIVIEAKHNINFYAILDMDPTPDKITITLEDSDTKISETFKYPSP